MIFLKQHYEKLILTAVLLLLVATAVLLPFQITATSQEVSAAENSPRPPRVKEYVAVDLSSRKEKIKRISEPVELKLTGEHQLFNPGEWDQRGNNSPPFPVSVLEPERAVVVESIEPLYTRAEFDGVSGSGPNAKYVFYIAQEASEFSQRRRPLRRSLGLFENSPNRDHPFELRRVEGDPGAPQRFVFGLSDSNEEITIVPGQPFARLDGYRANLKIVQPSERNLPQKYVGDSFRIDGKPYIIVAIDRNSVTVEAKSSANDSGKRTTIEVGTTDQN